MSVDNPESRSRFRQLRLRSPATKLFSAPQGASFKIAIIATVLALVGPKSTNRVFAQFDATVHLTKLDTGVTHYATFQSHNQKVVVNQHGVFASHIRDRDKPYLAQTWRLSRSTDGGATFATVFQQTHATNPPVIETDQAGNIFLMRVDFNSGDAFLYRFDAAKNFQDPTVTAIPGAAAGKYSMMLDRQHERLFFFAHNNSFQRIKLDGTVEYRTDLLRAGENAVLQYPLLALSDTGQLHAGWTTQKHGVYLYWDIHHMVSRDQGNTWKDLKGRPIRIPVVADDQGATDRISADDEFDAHTWLSSMAVTGGKSHFAYQAQTDPPREHYLRYDLTTGERDNHLYPEFKGDQVSLMGLSGFFVTEPQTPGLIYFVGNDSGRIACLRSRDNGQTWTDYARTDKTYAPYAIGGYRITDQGSIFGTFTQQRASDDVLDFQSDVYFFSIAPTDAK
jgi:hypothetical protein